jgi:hypothetical protein
MFRSRCGLNDQLQAKFRRYGHPCMAINTMRAQTCCETYARTVSEPYHDIVAMDETFFLTVSRGRHPGELRRRLVHAFSMVTSLWKDLDCDDKDAAVMELLPHSLRTAAGAWRAHSRGSDDRV